MHGWLGEACSHIGAVLFYIEVVIRKRDEESCTGRENAWLPPRVQVLKCASTSGMDFSSAKMKKWVLDGEKPRKQQACDANIAQATSEEWSALLSACHQSESRPVLLSSEAEYADNYFPVAARFPRVTLVSFRKDTMPASWEEYRKTAEGLTVEPQLTTRTAGRVTASNAKSVCCTSPGKPFHSLVKGLCYPQTMQFWAPQTAWGKENEKNARNAYIPKAVDLHYNFMFEESRLHISSAHPYLAATPDGLV